MGPLLGFGAFTLGGFAIVLMIIGCCTNNTALMGAAFIVGIPFMVVLVEAILHDYIHERNNR